MLRLRDTKTSIVVFLKKTVAFTYFAVVECLPCNEKQFLISINFNFELRGINMMKKILPAMIGAALAGGMTAAAADVTVFGHIDTSIVNWDGDLSYAVLEGGDPYDSGSAGADDTNLTCTTCSIGFKGSEDLGNGLKVMFKLDFQYDTINRHKGDSSKSLTDRDQWLGMGAKSFGKVRVGTISTGYKSHGAMIDPLYRTVAQARDVGLQSGLHSGAGEEVGARSTNTIRWDSPNFNGVKLVAHYVLDSGEGDGEDNNPFGLGASYSNGGILVFTDYLTNEGDGNENQSEITAWKLGGKYTMNNFSVFGQYESIEADYADADDIFAFIGIDAEDDLGMGFGDYHLNTELDVWHIGGTYTMGNNTLYAAFGQGDGDGTDSYGDGYLNSDVEYDVFTIAAIHTMSKRTSVYAAYNHFDGDATVTEKDGDFELYRTNANFESDVFALGIKHKF
jgi:predicted porin